MEKLQIEPRGSQFSRFFGNPVLGLAGSVASIIGVALAVYFYQAGRPTRELVCFLHPANAVVVRAGQSSRLQITLDGARVERDVTAAQVAFWNQGHESIRSENMLRPLVIRTTRNAPILEARIRKVSREVVGLTLDLARINQGEVRIDWKILEHHDGGIIQLIYFGDVDTVVNASATVDRQGEIHSLTYQGTAEQYGKRGRFEKYVGYSYLAVSVISGVLGLFMIRLRRSRGIQTFQVWSAGRQWTGLSGRRTSAHRSSCFLCLCT